MLENWFPTPIWVFDLADINNKTIEKYANTLSKKNKGRIISNYGGWQSNDFSLNDCENLELKKLATLVEQKVVEACVDLTLKPNFQVFMSNFWLNINNKTDSNLLHTHPTSFLSAVYYVKTHKKSSPIIFKHPSALMSFWWTSFCDTNTYITYPNINYQPIEGRLIIFPSWLEHEVNPNESNKPRISIAFNLEISSI